MAAQLVFGNGAMSAFGDDVRGRLATSGVALGRLPRQPQT